MGLAGFVEGRGLPLAPFGGQANRVEPAAYEDLGVRFAAEMPGRGSIGRFEIPLQDRQPRVAAFDDEPVYGSRRHRSADFALEFAQCRHDEFVLFGDIPTLSQKVTAKRKPGRVVSTESRAWPKSESALPPSGARVISDFCAFWYPRSFLDRRSVCAWGVEQAE